MQKRSWLDYLLIVLLIEKVIQHIVVSVSFVYDIGDIRSTVAVDYRILTTSGIVLAFLFMIAFWGTIRRRKWRITLVAALALFDIIGEFIAQGTIFITITVSVLVAIVLLILSYLEHRRYSIH